jgi:hypothetical protein
LLDRARCGKLYEPWTNLLKDWRNSALHVQQFEYLRRISYECAEDKEYLAAFEHLAYIEDHHGVRKWMQNRLVHRARRGEDGNVLPAEESPRAKVWRRANKIHRADLGPDKKAMPALIIYDIHGEVEEEQFYWHDKRMTQDELTDKINTLTLEFQLQL